MDQSPRFERAWHCQLVFSKPTQYCALQLDFFAEQADLLTGSWRISLFSPTHLFSSWHDYHNIHRIPLPCPNQDSSGATQISPSSWILTYFSRPIIPSMFDYVEKTFSIPDNWTVELSLLCSIPGTQVLSSNSLSCSSVGHSPHFLHVNSALLSSGTSLVKCLPINYCVIEIIRFPQLEVQIQ